MAWVHLVTLGALIEFFVFGWLVGSAREKYGIKAPAIIGHEIFERYFRVQQNTLELLIVFIPALWVAAQYWNPVWVAAIGVVFIIGRAIYCNAYVRDPAKRTIGFAFSSVPVIVLIIGAAIGVARALLA